MRELKFRKELEAPRCKNVPQKRMFDGYYKFSTQSTVVYDTHCLLDLGNEIMKLNIVCDRIFYRDGRIAVLDGTKLDIYADLSIEKSMDVTGHKNICDFLPSLEDKVGAISDEQWIFCVDDDLLSVTSGSVEFNGRSYVNEIHEDQCRYFVAWKGDVAILGNSKSLSFMYFYCKEQIDAEEYSPLCLRTDKDTFDPIPVDDIKFSGDRLLMMDTDTVTSYTIYDIELPKDTPDKRIVEYTIKDGHIVAEAGKADGDKLFAADSENETKPSDNKSSAALRKDSTISQDKLSSSGVNSSRISQTQEASSPKTPQGPVRPDAIDGGRRETFPSLSSLGSVSQAPQASQSNASVKATSFLSSKPGSSIASADGDSSTTLKSEVTEGSKHSSLLNPRNPELEQFEKSVVDRVDKLKNSLQNVLREPKPVTTLKFIESKYCLDELYNCIFNNQVEEYEQALSSMIVRLETLRAIDLVNVQESMRFFDSKIFENKSFRRPATYTDPLCSRFGEVMRLSNPVTDLVEGFKVIATQGSLVKQVSFESSHTKPGSRPDPAASNAPEGGKVFGDQPSPLDQESKSQESSITPEADQVSSLGSAAPSSTLFTNQPLFQDHIPGATVASFGGSLGTANPFKISDTTSLFNSLASNSNALKTDTIKNVSPAPSATVETAPGRGQDSTQPVSAFNRLAGTRKLFQ